MKKILVIFGVLMLVVLMCGCTELNGSDDSQQVEDSEMSRFVGTWQNSEYSYQTITCFSNGSCLYLGEVGDYELKDGKFVFNFFILGESFVHDYVFSNNDNTLTLTRDSYTGVFYKQ